MQIIMSEVVAFSGAAPSLQKPWPKDPLEEGKVYIRAYKKKTRARPSPYALRERSIVMRARLI